MCINSPPYLRFAVSNKLDVMTSKQFNHITVLNIDLVVYTFLGVVILSAVCNTVWYEPDIRKIAYGKEVAVRKCRPSNAYSGALIIIDIIGRCTLFILCIAYTIRIARTKGAKHGNKHGPL